MRTSYFKDIAESMAKRSELEMMANGNYAKSKKYGNTYYSDIARSYQGGGPTGDGGQSAYFETMQGRDPRNITEQEFNYYIRPLLVENFGQAWQNMPFNEALKNFVNRDDYNYWMGAGVSLRQKEREGDAAGMSQIRKNALKYSKTKKGGDINSPELAMQAGRTPTKQEFLSTILPTLGAGYARLSPDDAYNAFKELTVKEQRDAAAKAGIGWQDATSVGMSGPTKTNISVAEPIEYDYEEQQDNMTDYDLLGVMSEEMGKQFIPSNTDGSMMSMEQWYKLPLGERDKYMQDVASIIQANSDSSYVGVPVQEITRQGVTGYDVSAPPTQDEAPGKTFIRPYREVIRRKKASNKPKTLPPSQSGTAPYQYSERGISPEQARKNYAEQQRIAATKKQYSGGPNTMMDFFGNARANVGYPMARLQDGQLMTYYDLDKAGLGNFFKGVGRTLHDYGRGMFDSLGNITGLYDLSNEKYKTKFGKKFAGTADKWSRGLGSIGRVAADVFLPGAGTALSMAGQALNPQGLGAKQQQRDLQKAAMAGNMASGKGYGFPDMGGQPYAPGGQENLMSALAPSIASLLPSLLGGPLSPGGARGAYGTNIGDPGVYAQGGMPMPVFKHMQFMQMFEDPDDYRRGSGPYLVY